MNNVTELVFILDRSGSMAGLESDTIGGFNAMLEKQKKEPGTAYVSTVLFNNFGCVLHDRLEVQKVPPMTDADYQVGGCTALVDAIGDAIHHIGNIHKYARPEDVPHRTLFVITTDGMENGRRPNTAGSSCFWVPTLTRWRPPNTSASARIAPSTTAATAAARR